MNFIKFDQLWFLLSTRYLILGKCVYSCRPRKTFTKICFPSTMMTTRDCRVAGSQGRRPKSARNKIHRFMIIKVKARRGWDWESDGHIGTGVKDNYVVLCHRITLANLWLRRNYRHTHTHTHLGGWVCEKCGSIGGLVCIWRRKRCCHHQLVFI